MSTFTKEKNVLIIRDWEQFEFKDSELTLWDVVEAGVEIQNIKSASAFNKNKIKTHTNRSELQDYVCLALC